MILHYASVVTIIILLVMSASGTNSTFEPAYIRPATQGLGYMDFHGWQNIQAHKTTSFIYRLSLLRSYWLKLI